MARITPPPNTEGLFLVRLPWALNPAVSYKVGALRSFDELISRKINPVTMVYTPVGLGQLEYEQDVAAGALIVTLLSANGSPIYIPDTYIQAYPNMAVVPHSWLIASVSLGMMPDTWDVSGLTQAMQTTVSDYTGVESTVTISRAPTTDVITQDQYIQLAAARTAAIKNRSSLYADKLSLTAEKERLENEIAELYVLVEMQQARIDELEGSAPE